MKGKTLSNVFLSAKSTVMQNLPKIARKYKTDQCKHMSSSPINIDLPRMLAKIVAS